MTRGEASGERCESQFWWYAVEAVSASAAWPEPTSTARSRLVGSALATCRPAESRADRRLHSPLDSHTTLVVPRRTEAIWLPTQSGVATGRVGPRLPAIPDPWPATKRAGPVNREQSKCYRLPSAIATLSQAILAAQSLRIHHECLQSTAQIRHDVPLQGASEAHPAADSTRSTTIPSGASSSCVGSHKGEIAHGAEACSRPTGFFRSGGN